MNHKKVTVAIFHPNDTTLKPYVYGVFNSSEAADLYFQLNGDVAGGNIACSTGTYIDASPQAIEQEFYPTRKVEQTAPIDNAMARTYGRPFEG